MGEREGELLRLACLSLRDLADGIKVPYTTVRNWSAGRIEVPTEKRREIAAFLRKHAKALEKAAKELEG